jgi:hypothetical protein
VAMDSAESTDATFHQESRMPQLNAGNSLDRVTESLEINPAQDQEINNPVFLSTAQGLHHTSMAVGVRQHKDDGSTVTVVSGAAHSAAPS